MEQTGQLSFVSIAHNLGCDVDRDPDTTHFAAGWSSPVSSLGS